MTTAGGSSGSSRRSPPTQASSVDDYKSWFSSVQVVELQGHKKKINTIGWNSTGARLASGSTDNSLRIWDVEKRTSVELKGHTGSVDSLAWHPKQPDRLATVSSDKTVRQWDVRSGRCTHTLATQGENILVSWRPQGDQIAFSNRDDVVSALDADKWAVTSAVKFEKGDVNEMAFVPSGETLLIASAYGSVELVRWQAGGVLERSAQFFGHPAPCFSVEVDPQGRWFALSSADSLVSIWDLQDFICMRTFSRFEYAVRCVSFSYDGALLASACETAVSDEQVVDITLAASGTQVHAIKHQVPVNSSVWHPSKYLLAFGGGSGKPDEPSPSIRVLGFPPP